MAHRELGWRESDTLGRRMSKYGFDIMKDVPVDAMHQLAIIVRERCHALVTHLQEVRKCTFNNY